MPWFHRQKQSPAPAPGLPIACPRCGSPAAIPILYGAPTPVHMQMAMAGAITPGGAMGRLIGGQAPQWECRSCETQWRGGLYTGGDGSSPAAAVTIAGIGSTAVGIRMEIQYLTERFGPDDQIAGDPQGWHLEGQTFMQQDDRAYDMLTVRLPDGTLHAVIFDITGFFGRMP